MVDAKSLGDEARQSKWAPKGHSRRRAQARGHSAPHVDRRNRVQLVEKGGCRVTSNNEIKGFPQRGGKRCPCRDDGGGEIARFFASSQSERLRLQPHVDRRNRVQLVEKGGCRVTSNNEIKGIPQHGGKRCPCRDDGGGEIARFFASSQSERLRLQH